MKHLERSQSLARLALACTTLLAATTLSGCVVFGASSSGGWFIWPGGLGLVLMILLIVFVLRRR